LHLSFFSLLSASALGLTNLAQGKVGKQATGVSAKTDGVTDL
jgi:hypothetical protein